MNKLISLLLAVTLISVLSACGGGGTSANPSSAPKQGVTFSFSKDALVSAKTMSKTLAAATIDPAAKCAAITVTDVSGNLVLSNYKIDIYSMNGGYITATVPLAPGSYQITQFLVLDSNNNVLYLVPTQSATSDIKALVSTVLPLPFGVTKDLASTVTVQVLAPDSSNPQDFGYPSIAFSIVSYVRFMSCVQIMDTATNSWKVTDASLKVNGVSYSEPAQTVTLRVAQANSYALVFTKTGYDPKSITLSAADIASYQSTPLVVTLTPTVYRTVTFDSNGGSPVAPQSVANGGLATRPADPTRAGYTFAGWYVDLNVPPPFDFINTPITADITLHAKWNTLISFTFTWSNPPTNSLMIGGVYRNGVGSVILSGSSFVATVAGAGGGGDIPLSYHNGTNGDDSRISADEATYLYASGGEGASERDRDGGPGNAYGVGFSNTTFTDGGGGSGGGRGDYNGGNGGLAIGTQTKAGTYDCTVGAGGTYDGQNGSITIVINP